MQGAPGGRHSGTEPTSGNVIGAPEDLDALPGFASPARVFVFYHIEGNFPWGWGRAALEPKIVKITCLTRIPPLLSSQGGSVYAACTNIVHQRQASRFR
jgi:hypothetical protein